MKQKTNLLTFIILLLSIILHTSCKEIENSDTISDDTQLATRSSGNAVWDYPIKPGMEEWNKLRTEPDRVAALQVPEHILSRLSAEDAVHLCITFPLFEYHIYFRSSQGDGFSVMLNRFNIFRHLLARNDVGTGLLAAYKDAGMTGYKTLPYSREFWVIKLDYLELVLAQKEILQSLTSEEKKELLFEARKKLSEKIVDEAFSSVPGIQPSLRIMVSVLDMEQYPGLTSFSNRQAIERFIQTGMLDDVSLIDKIVKITDNNLKVKNEAK